MRGLVQQKTGGAGSWLRGDARSWLAHHQVWFRSAAVRSPLGGGAGSTAKARPSQGSAYPVRIAAKESSLSRGAASAVRLQTGHWHLRNRQRTSPACEPQQDWLPLPRLCQQKSGRTWRTPGLVKGRAIPAEGREAVLLLLLLLLLCSWLSTGQLETGKTERLNALLPQEATVHTSARSAALTGNEFSF